MPEDREETKESILENIDEWFIYAEEDHNEPNLEDRVSILEDMISILIGG